MTFRDDDQVTCGVSAGAASPGRTRATGGRSRMSRLAFTSLATIIGGSACAADSFDLAGYDVVLQDQFIETAEGGHVALRLRFVMPELANDAITYAELAPGLLALCEAAALPLVTEDAPEVSQITLSLAAAPIPFGEARPDVRQVFEVFEPKNGTCIWGDL